MNHSDRSQGSMPVRHTEIVPAPAGHEHHNEMTVHDGPTGGKKITAKLIGRAVRRHWWQAALLWVVGSIGLMAVAYLKVKPTYIAFARIRVDPGERPLFVQGGGGGDNGFGEYKETQVNHVTNPRVIEQAIGKHPNILLYPRLKQADDHVAEIRSALNVAVLRGTNLIEVSMVSESTMEATDIVNAVVEAYHKSANDTNSEETMGRIGQLRKVKEEKGKEVEDMRAKLRQRIVQIGAADVSDVKSKNSITLEQYSQLSGELMKVSTDIYRAEARLVQLQNDQVILPVSATGEVRAVTERDVEEAFYNHPMVFPVKEKYELASQKFKELSEKIRNPLDPPLVKQSNAMRDASKQMDELFKKLKPKIEAQLQAQAMGGGPAGTGGMDNGLRAAEAELASLKAWESKLKENLETLNVKQKDAGVSALTLEFDKMDLGRAVSYYDKIEVTLAQLEYDTQSPLARIRVEFYAKPSPRPNTSNRLKIMAMAPVGMMLGVIGLLVLLELHAGRVVDPEDIPSRIRVPVIGVVPPLPQIRATAGAISSRDEFRTQRQLDQFVQSLDHLRVALCSGRDAWGRERRCILITSACGSEGKTTLAAQLAERCVNAGLRTLLIDGDLRNPTLTRMLDVANSRGLINVLRGEVGAEEAMSIVGGAGGFHFMPSGTPKVDPSRLLHGDRLGKLLTQARESFDIVIVDAPPVLPVPDALTIGRWTDGAVLAVRYDMSRFPLVEKANRRLASVGVPVIGAVVNGVKVGESAYGSYYPSYAYSNDRAAQTPLDV